MAERKYRKPRVMVVSDGNGEVINYYIVSTARDIEHVFRAVMGEPTYYQSPSFDFNSLLWDLRRYDALDTVDRYGEPVSFAILTPSELPGEPGDECDVDG